MNVVEKKKDVADVGSSGQKKKLGEDLALYVYHHQLLWLL